MSHFGKQTALRISLLYAVIAGMWIFLSDYLLVLFIPNVEQLAALQTYNGGVFVGVTSLLLYFLLRRELRKQEQVETTLQERETRYRTLVDSVDDVLYTLDRQQRHTGIYGRWLEKSGTSPDLFLGKTAREILGHEVGYHHEKANARALRGENVVYDWSAAGPEGTQFYQTSVSPLKDARGEIIGVVGVGRDLTERREMEMALQQERDFAESLIQTAQIIILVLDTRGRIIRFNPYLEELAGYRLAEVQGKSWFATFLPEQEQAHVQNLFSQALDNVQTYGNVNSIVTKDGRHLAIEWYDKTLKDGQGQTVGLLAVGRDITEQLSAQQMLKQRVEERTRELSTLLEISGKIISTLELEPLLDLILDQLKNVVDYTQAIIFGLPSQASQFILLTARGVPAPTATLRLQFSEEKLQVSPQSFDHHGPLLNGDIDDNSPLAAMFRRIAGGGSAEAPSPRSQMVVPLVVKDRLVGLLGFSHEEANHYSRHEADLVSAFASQVAVAIENARLYSQTRKHLDELETLLTVQQAITSRLDPADVLQLIADEARRLTATHLSMVYLLDDDHLQIAVFSGDPGPDISVGYKLPLDGSGAGLAIRSGLPILTQDAQTDPRIYADVARRLGIRAYLVAPLISVSRPIGAVAVADKEKGQLDADDERVVMLLASGAAIGLENARFYQQERERRQALEALYRADEELYRYLDTDRVLQALVDVAIDILEVEKSATMIWDESREKLVPHSARGFRISPRAPIAFDLGEGLIGQAAGSGEMVVVEDAHRHAGVARQITDPEGICSFVHVPIKINSKIFGVFNVSYTQPHRFSVQDRRLLTALSQRAALAIENARLHEQARKSAALEERQRLARELHDAVTQNLFSATLITEVLPKLWEKDPQEGNRLLKDLRLLSRGALAEMRTLLLELRPTALAETSLGDLLRQLAEAVMGRKGIPVEVVIEGQNDSLPTDVRLGLYRIAQEALNNVAKHARANQVIVSLRHTLVDVNGEAAPVVELRINDDGRGFDPACVAPERLGLNIMRERAKSLEATLTIDSEPDAGTLIFVRWHGSSE